MPGLPLPWMFHGSSFGRPRSGQNGIERNSERFMASTDSRIDSSAGSSVSAEISMTPIAIANGAPSPE